VSAIAATFLLVGCTTTTRMNVEATEATLRSCEMTIYYTPDADSATALECANLLDIWR
jgi:hypothetical protein